MAKQLWNLSSVDYLFWGLFETGSTSTRTSCYCYDMVYGVVKTMVDWGWVVRGKISWNANSDVRQHTAAPWQIVGGHLKLRGIGGLFWEVEMEGHTYQSWCRGGWPQCRPQSPHQGPAGTRKAWSDRGSGVREALSPPLLERDPALASAQSSQPDNQKITQIVSQQHSPNPSNSVTKPKPEIPWRPVF